MLKIRTNVNIEYLQLLNSTLFCNKSDEFIIKSVSIENRWGRNVGQNVMKLGHP